MDTIFCRTTSQGIQSFYVKTDTEEYFIFSQSFRKSVKEHFQKGLSIDGCLDYSLAKSSAVRRTLDKLKVYIPYVEKEYGIALYNRTKSRLVKRKKTKVSSERLYRYLLEESKL